MRYAIDKIHDVAAASGARIVPSCGFDSVPSDITTYALAGAAIGGVVGYATDKNDECDGYYGDGRYVDDDCRYDDRYARYW